MEVAPQAQAFGPGSLPKRIAPVLPWRNSVPVDRYNDFGRIDAGAPGNAGSAPPDTFGQAFPYIRGIFGERPRRRRKPCRFVDTV